MSFETKPLLLTLPAASRIPLSDRLVAESVQEAPEGLRLGAPSMEFAGVRSIATDVREAADTQVYFRDGWVRVDAPALLHNDLPASVEVYRGGKQQTYERPLPQPVWSWSYRREAEHFIEQVRSGGQFRSSGEDTLADVKLFEEIYRAYLQQHPVNG